ncbi:MAG: M28 family peptidase [Prevotella sp.]|nr:M28 family peptidase [Prevotella sp.]
MRILLLIICALGISACSTTKKSQDSSQTAVSIRFDADSAYAFCAAQCDFGPRTMNSEAHERCGQWIAEKFRQYGCQVELQQADLKGYDGTLLKSTNIIARQAATADSQKPRILVCAHWDSRPWADNDLDEENWHKPVLGANDGASGIAVMLELARILQQHDSAAVTVDFVCFDAEDWGVPQWSNEADADSWALGAQHWASSPQAKAGGYQYGILLDMVGGQGAKFYRELISMQYARNIVEKVWQAANTAGYGSVFVQKDGGMITDDHVPVNEKANIPCIDIINHYPDCPQSSFGPTWHTVNDDMEHIDKNTLHAVGQTLVQLIYTD